MIQSSLDIQLSADLTIEFAKDAGPIRARVVSVAPDGMYSIQSDTDKKSLARIKDAMTQHVLVKAAGWHGCLQFRSRG